uniref:Methyltransf_21 domain-containing protein n=2 Tax=Caenorhabditis tropicalis TaxID=1561998 RepID=A0A1I7SXN9_9PELO
MRSSIRRLLCSLKMVPFSGYLPISLLLFILLLGISNYFTLNHVASQIKQVPQVAPRPARPVVRESTHFKSDSDDETRQARQNPVPSQNDVPVYSDAEKKLRTEALQNVESDRQKVLSLASGTDSKLFYRAIKKGALCRNQNRIGAIADGGKEACNVQAVRKNDCTLVSLGLHNQIDFDQAIHVATGGHCKILGVDKSEQNEETQQIYSQMGGQLFVGMIPSEITLPDMMRQAGRNEVEILKIDIEGGEFAGLEPLIKDFLVCQIMIEIHGKPMEHLNLLRVMSRYGFRIFNVETNPFCPKCCEYSLINELCMAQFGAIPLGATIPN